MNKEQSTPSLDDKKQKEIMNSFLWNSELDSSNISVTVKGVKATLKGSVSSFSQSAIAEDEALGVSGISIVNNQLKVEYSDVPDDEEIKSNIEKMLSWNSVMNHLKIDVSVKNGIVTLEGNVNAHWQLSRIENLINEMKGVVNIRNKLAVVPMGTYSDEKIAEQIVANFKKSFLLNTDKITVNVVAGIVTLTGTVPSWICKKWAGTQASFIAGVGGVCNKIAVKH